MAGRPKGSSNRVKTVTADMAKAVLASVDQRALWGKHLKSKDARLSLEALKYLTDRAYGKAPQAVLLQGDKTKPFEVIIRVLGAH